MILSDILMDERKFESAGECSMIINGLFVTKNSSLVYASLKGKKIFYYTKATENKILKKSYVEDDFINALCDDRVFCKQRFESLPRTTENNLKVEIDADLRIIFIETFMYSQIREMIMYDNYLDASLHVRETDTVIDNSTIQKMVQLFKNASYSNYLSTVYTNKFLNRIFKTRENRFYSVMKVFIPIMIKCKYLYNPLLDNPSIHFTDSRLYRDALEKNRKTEVLPNNTLSAVLATHNEICESLGMTRMVRFTPQFMYQFIVGFLLQGDPRFPNINTKIWISTSKDYSYFGLKPYYKKGEFSVKLDECRKENWLAKLECLNAYVESDSLWYAISNERTKLIHYGTSILDSKENCTTNALYGYLAQASLF